jgi:hypothetical protein
MTLLVVVLRTIKRVYINKMKDILSCESMRYDIHDRFLILMWQNSTANETLIQIGKEIPRQEELSETKAW